jgi:hypothetical protein
MSLDHITIRAETGFHTFKVAAELSPTRVIFVDDAGLFEFADLRPGDGWDRSSADPTESEKAVLSALIASHGGFDQTTVAVTPPSTAS